MSAAARLTPAQWARLMPWLDRALDVPADEHERWLAAQDLDDALRADLSRLLAQRRAMNADRFLQGEVGPKFSVPAEGPAAGPSASADKPDAPGDPGPTLQDGLFAGDLIGPWRLVRLLGQGGMSVVWLAERDDGQVRRHVALKMPHAGPGQALLAARLRRERDFLAALEHPHIARLYDVGVTPQGLPYMALEHVDGVPLHLYAHRQQLGVVARLQLFMQVLGAVQHAHQQLVLHRDLKPGNILVDAQGQVKLLDFGIAKLIRGTDGPAESGTAPSTELTQFSGQMLTPDYAAPEQIAGLPLTTASDVYALGVILFELLTGQRPYRLPRGTRGALEEAILAAEVRRPSQVWREHEASTLYPDAATPAELARHFHSSPARLAQRLQGDLDVIVGQALQKDPTRRYASADALALDIRRHLASEPIAAQADSRWYRTRKYVRRYAWALSAMTAVVAALSVGLGLALWQAREARQEAAKARAIQGFLVGLFENGDVEQPDALRKRQQTVQDLLVGSAHALKNHLQDQPQVRAELQGVLGRLLHNLALGDDAIAVRQQRVQQLQALDATKAELAQAWRDLADSQDARGDVKGAAQSLKAGLGLCREADMTPAALCWGLQATLAWQDVLAGKLDQARSQIEPALAALREQAPGTAELAEAMVYEGDALSNANEADKAYALYQESMAIRSKLWGPQSVRLARERYQLAIGLWSQGRLSQALRELQQAERDMTASLGAEHTNTLIVTVQHERLQAHLDMRHTAVRRMIHAVQALTSRSDLVDPRTIFDVTHAAGEVLQMIGDLEGARPYLLKARLQLNALRGQLPETGIAESDLASNYQDEGDYVNARLLLKEAIQRTTAVHGQNSPYVKALEGNLLSVNVAEAMAHGVPLPNVAAADLTPPLLIDRGDRRGALALAISNMHALEATPRTDQIALSRYIANDQLGRAYAAMGQPADASKALKEALNALSNAHPLNPYLTVTRARLLECEVKQNHAAEAKTLADQIRMRMALPPRLAPHFDREVQHALGAWNRSMQSK